MNLCTDYIESAIYLSNLVGNRKPEIVIVCGSGLAHLSTSLTDPITVKYSSIPGFVDTTVQGHSGQMVFGILGGISCVCLRGRFHYYEGHEMSKVVFPIRVVRLLGVKMMIATNAAGGLNENFNVGDIVCIQDHFGGPVINGMNPLRGPNDPLLGPRFPPMSDAFDEKLQEMIIDISKKLDLNDVIRPNGTYCFSSGPSYESIPESKFFRSIGGDCVGMSTVPEVVAARHMGMKIVCLSLITNKVVTSRKKWTVHASHEEVIAAAAKAGINVQRIVESFVTKKLIGDYLDQQPSAPNEVIETLKKQQNSSITMLFGIALPFIASMISLK